MWLQQSLPSLSRDCMRVPLLPKLSAEQCMPCQAVPVLLGQLLILQRSSQKLPVVQPKVWRLVLVAVD